MTTQLSEIFLSNLGHNILVSILDIDRLLMKSYRCHHHYNYFEIDELKTLRNTTGANKQLSILSMNIQSIHAKFQEREVFIETLQNVDFKWTSDNIILCRQFI